MIKIIVGMIAGAMAFAYVSASHPEVVSGIQTANAYVEKAYHWAETKIERI